MGVGPIRVLHVDDEERITALTKSHLESTDDSFEVLCAQSAGETLDLLEAEDVDCVVSDYDMPGMTGLELLESVREEYPDLPYILLTGKGSEAIASEAISAGVTDYLQKTGTPEQYEILGQRIKNAVEKRQTERQLDVEQEFVQRAIDTLPDVFMSFDAGLDPIRWNERIREVTGYTDDEIAGMSPLDFFPPEEHDYVESRLRELFEEGTSTMQVNLLTSEGERIPHEFRGAALTDDGEVVGIVGVGRDISDRQARERELEAYETIVETVPDGVLLLDEDGRMVRVNGAFADIVGYDEATLEGMPFETLVADGVVDESVVDAYVDLVGELLSDDTDRERGTFRTTVRPPSADEPRTYEVHVALLPYEEEFQGAVGVARDVTDELTRRTELERKNERLEEFASVVSHDLRAPLSVARTRTELAMEAGEGDTGHLEDAMRAHDRMAELIDDLLALARQGAEAADPLPVSLADVARAGWSSVNPADAALETGADPTILADPGQLQQLFENLFRNVDEHAGTGVTVRVDVTDDGFVVADDGRGIPADHRDDVLQYGESLAEEGTGLGLAIVRDIAAGHGWSVDVGESDAGGAAFGFSGVEFEDD